MPRFTYLKFLKPRGFLAHAAAPLSFPTQSLRPALPPQRRAWAQNLCLVGLPLLFCVLLLVRCGGRGLPYMPHVVTGRVRPQVLQRLVNTQLGSSDDYRCGCKCLECCDWVEDAGRRGDNGGCIAPACRRAGRQAGTRRSGMRLAAYKTSSSRLLPGSADSCRACWDGKTLMTHELSIFSVNSRTPSGRGRRGRSAFASGVKVTVPGGSQVVMT